MSTEAGPSTQRLSTLVSYATSDLDSDSESPPPSPATTAAPASTGLGTTSATPVNITPAPATSIFSAQPLLAAMAERWQAPTKATTAFGRILRMERVREVDMRVGKVPTFARSANQEAILGQSRGVEKYEGCEKCEEGEGPFTSCVTVAGEFSGSCSNCHYNSMGATCSFRPSKRRRSPSLEEVSNPATTFGTTARTANKRRKGRAEAFQKHWDGISEIIRDIIIDRFL